jgi:hypothetical protein
VDIGKELVEIFEEHLGRPHKIIAVWAIWLGVVAAPIGAVAAAILLVIGAYGWATNQLTHIVGYTAAILIVSLVVSLITGLSVPRLLSGSRGQKALEIVVGRIVDRRIERAEALLRDSEVKYAQVEEQSERVREASVRVRELLEEVDKLKMTSADTDNQ